MKRLPTLLALGMILLVSCSTPRPTAESEPKFREAKNADIIVRHYSETLSRVFKPLQMEGPFLTGFDKDAVIGLAKQQSGRELAVVILLRFNASDRVKQSWLGPLRKLGYKRIVFLRAEKGMEVDGLSILEDPSEITGQPEAPVKPNV
jgi:hypothetical protein